MVIRRPTGVPRTGVQRSLRAMPVRSRDHLTTASRCWAKGLAARASRAWPSMATVTVPGSGPRHASGLRAAQRRLLDVRHVVKPHWSPRAAAVRRQPDSLIIWPPLPLPRVRHTASVVLVHAVVNERGCQNRSPVLRRRKARIERGLTRQDRPPGKQRQTEEDGQAERDSRPHRETDVATCGGDANR